MGISATIEVWTLQDLLKNDSIESLAPESFVIRHAREMEAFGGAKTSHKHALKISGARDSHL
jgi:hypothetical protein